MPRPASAACKVPQAVPVCVPAYYRRPSWIHPPTLSWQLKGMTLWMGWGGGNAVKCIRLHFQVFTVPVAYAYNLLYMYQGSAAKQTSLCAIMTVETDV